ncbi:MAG: DNA primase, partial [Patescibacteria group bacterium]|nr:DNA primase [Patescibacteria group bacterium]
KGDIFSFVEQFEGLDFMGALKLLADRAGVPLNFQNKEQKTERERLYAVMEAAYIFYQSQLAGEPLEYLKKRGVKEETVREFRLGWAPDGWRNLRDALAKKGFSDTDMEKAGLTKKSDKGYYDRFRGRVMFPIMDSSGRVIAFSGRLLHEKEGEGKYINTPDSPLYDKSAVLYGIDKAKGEIRKKNYSILVEGQMDLIMSHQAGIKNTVAASGTALADDTVSREHVTNNLGLVRRLSPNVLIAFDSDKAGRNAALRAARIALNLGMDVKIADIEGGKDPADLVLSDPENWKNTLRHAKPVIEFVLDGIMKEKNDARKLPAIIREKILPFVAEIQGAMERSHWIKMIHDKTGLSEEAVRDDLKSILEKKIVETTRTTRETQSNSKTSYARIDLVVRKLLGLLWQAEKTGSMDTKKYFDNMQRIAGPDYRELVTAIEPYKDELILEAEITFGTGRNAELEIAELLINFEEDFIKKKLAIAMADLAAAERAKDVTASNAAAKLCQELSKKLAEVGKKK